jgi:ribosome-associated protein
VLSSLSPKTLADLLVEAAEDKKAWDPVAIDLHGKTSVADYFVVCEGETDRQLRSIADEMIGRARAQKVRPLAVDGYEQATWILLDFDAVLAHIFLPGERSYYDLEGLWNGAAQVRDQAG